jgi:hypothetical protein
VADVVAHFKKVFGADPHPSYEEATAKVTDLSAQLTTLSQQAASGDVSAIEQLTKLSIQLQDLQSAMTLAGRLGIPTLQCTDHVFWVNGSLEDAYTGPVPRGVTVGTDLLLKRTAIRYFAGTAKSAANPGAGDAGVDDAGSADTEDAGVETGNGGGDGDNGDDSDGGASTRKKGSGGCTLSTNQSHVAGVWGWLMLAWVFCRRRAARA